LKILEILGALDIRFQASVAATYYVMTLCHAFRELARAVGSYSTITRRISFKS